MKIASENIYPDNENRIRWSLVLYKHLICETNYIFLGVLSRIKERLHDQDQKWTSPFYIYLKGKGFKVSDQITRYNIHVYVIICFWEYPIDSIERNQKWALRIVIKILSSNMTLFKKPPTSVTFCFLFGFYDLLVFLLQNKIWFQFLKFFYSHEYNVYLCRSICSVNYWYAFTVCTL